MSELGKPLILVGLFILIVGIIFTSGTKIPFLGRLPGDILIQKGNFTFFAPIVTSIILSIIFTVLLNLFFRR